LRIVFLKKQGLFCRVYRKTSEGSEKVGIDFGEEETMPYKPVELSLKRGVFGG